MIPPQLLFTTFNKLAMTQRTLPSYLNTNQDFEMYIVDNDSRDNTWDYVQSLNDPRIVAKKRFDRNFGSINSINWVLTQRKPKQSFINVEYDAYNLTSDFVDKFQQVADEFGAAFIHAHYVREEKIRYTQTLLKNNVWFCPVELPKCPPFSFAYVPYWVFDRLGYLDEASCLMDYEFIHRIVLGLKKQVGMTLSVVCWHEECKDKFCPEASVKQRIYPMLSKYNIEKRREVLQTRLGGGLRCGSANPLKCGTYHKRELAPWEDEMRKSNFEFMANTYEEWLKCQSWQ